MRARLREAGSSLGESACLPLEEDSSLFEVAGPEPAAPLLPGPGDPAAAALREAFEEIGLAPDKVELLGCLPPHMTVSGFLVHPFVGWVEPPVEFVLDAHEVAEVFEVPLAFVLDSKNHLRDSLVVHGLRRSFYVLPYPGHRIWGATAGILVSLARILGPRAASGAE